MSGGNCPGGNVRAPKAIALYINCGMLQYDNLIEIFIACAFVTLATYLVTCVNVISVHVDKRRE